MLINSLDKSSNVDNIQECGYLTLWAVCGAKPLEAFIWDMYTCLYSKSHLHYNTIRGRKEAQKESTEHQANSKQALQKQACVDC